jgi:hypothetical protein
MKRKLLSSLLVVPLAVAGFVAYNMGQDTNTTTTSTTTSVAQVTTATPVSTSTDADATTIDLSSEQGSTVEITKAGTYVLTGTYTGQIHVNADKAKVTIILKDATITSNDGPAIYAEDADKTILTLEGTSKVTDSTNYSETDATPADAAIYAQDSLTINGSGSLTVDGNYKAGIRTKDNLVIESGTVTVDASTDAIKATDSLSITGGELNLTAGNDGIQASGTDSDQGMMSISGGTVNISATKQGLQATNTLDITGGTININDSYEGVQAAIINIKGGQSTIKATDDGLNASSDTASDLQINISDGTLEVYAGLSSQGDGLDSNGSITISGGTTRIYDPEQAGDWSSVDSDSGVSMTGGNVIKVSSNGTETELTESTIASQAGPGGGMGGGHGMF